MTMHTIALTPPSETIAHARSLADKLATNERRPAYVVMDGAHPLVACPDDMGVYWNADQVVYTAEPHADDLPGIENEPSEPPVYPEDNGRAPSLFELIVAECQAELDARLAALRTA